MPRREFGLRIASGIAVLQEGRIDVAIIGAGVFGSWIAYECRRRGKSVLLVDCRGPANSLSSSGCESRILRVGYGPQRLYSEWAKRSIEKWSEVFNTTNENGLVSHSGMLWIGSDGDAYLAATATTLKDLSIRFETLSANQVQSRYPYIAVDKNCFGILETNSGFVLARRAVQELVQKLQNRGLIYRRLLVQQPTSIHAKTTTHVAATNMERIAAKQFVFACGPWLAKVFPDVVGNLILPTRQEVFFFASPTGELMPGPPIRMAWVEFHRDRIFYGTPDVENRGFKVASDRHGRKIDPDSEDRLPSRDGLHEVRSFLEERFPFLSTSPCVETRVCQYENTESGDFLIDRHPAADNVWIVGGGSGHGFKHGPAIGEYVASLLDGAPLNPKFTRQQALLEKRRRVH